MKTVCYLLRAGCRHSSQAQRLEVDIADRPSMGELIRIGRPILTDARIRSGLPSVDVGIRRVLFEGHARDMLVDDGQQHVMGVENPAATTLLRALQKTQRQGESDEVLRGPALVFTRQVVW